MRSVKFIKMNRSEDTNSCNSLSDLPDEILRHILRKLPTKAAAKMSLLSKKFMELWTSIGVLKIRQNRFKNRSLFINFVDRTLFFQDWSSLKVFGLSCKVSSEASRINAWISAVMRANVEVLHLSLKNVMLGYRLPYCLFNSHSLTTFCLDMPCILNLPYSISLPCLKILRLKHVNFADADSTQQLLGSPALEELSLSKCVYTFKSLSIHAPKLQKLSIDESLSEDVSYQIIEFFCTSLESFYYEGDIEKAEFGIYCSSSLVKVTIDLPNSSCYELHGERIFKILKGLTHVKDLSLSHGCLEGLDTAELINNLPVFGKVTKFKLDRAYIHQEAISHLLSKFLRLAILELKDVHAREAEEDEDFPKHDELILNPVPSCFRSHLKKIIISGTFLPKIGPLLKASEVLKAFVFYWNGPSEEEEEILQQLQELRKGSEHCEISLL